MGNRRRTTPQGFTLTEMLVAVALLVVVMLAVSTIFRTTSQTVSTGLAVTELLRRQTTARSSLYTDICGTSANPQLQGTGMLPVDGVPGDRPPFLLIRCQRQLGFLDRASYDTNGGAVPALPSAVTNPAGWSAYPGTYEYRQDMLGLFSRGQFRRQTGGGPGITPRVEARAREDADLAYIWYGHLWQPDNDDPNTDAGWYADAGNTIPTMPGSPLTTPQNNPNNYFARQWTLGRVALPMVEPGVVSIGGYYTNPNGVMDDRFQPLWYFGRPANGYLASGAYPAYPYFAAETTGDVRNGLLPFEPFISHVTDGTVNGAGVGIYCGYSSPGTWWGGRLVEGRYDVIGTHAGMSWDQFAQMVATQNDPADATHYDYLTSQWAENHIVSRFQGYQAADVATLTGEAFARTLSRAVPVFMTGCARFTVEFAGDFINQQANGTLAAGLDYHTNARFTAADYAAAQTDGVIDFNIDPATGRRTIRWYGAFRNEDGTPVTMAQMGGALTVSAPGYMPVAPVCYSRRTGQAPNMFQYMPFEQVVPPFTGSLPSAVAADNVYTCAWTLHEMSLINPPYTLAPKLIRITIQMVDADGRVEGGMTQQYVFPVKSNR